MKLNTQKSLGVWIPNAVQIFCVTKKVPSIFGMSLDPFSRALFILSALRILLFFYVLRSILEFLMVLIELCGQLTFQFAFLVAVINK